ncbi:hypothetical protein [Agrobacterium tumefaciens]|uniref:hypothetical protein n=1 Tax=Agrobacterium tumefaciens TaxID=358 RepID=UPI002243492F|nr:hypothetical protein [Agrobacterium tumefaciens]MCW8061200.1 hypothetical protein [Agrobacterium tumefaciens]MCW8146051.1 hypothetical protein [Agrobacterium tumefaciens]
MLADKEGLGRKLVKNALQSGLVRNRLKVDAGLAWLAYGQGACGVAAYMFEEPNDILRRYFQPLTDFCKMGFRKEVGEPGQQPVRADRP